jgi:hypothetical protein
MNGSVELTDIYKDCGKQACSRKTLGGYAWYEDAEKVEIFGLFI